MNIVKQLEALGLIGWTWRGDSNVERPMPALLNEGKPNERLQTQEEADEAILSRIEWSGEMPSLTWGQLENAVNSQSSYDAALSAGFDTGLGFKLSVTQYAQGRLSVLKNGIDTLKEVMSIPDSTEVPIWDQQEQKHMVTITVFKQIMAAYTLHCINIEP